MVNGVQSMIIVGLYQCSSCCKLLGDNDWCIINIDTLPYIILVMLSWTSRRDYNAYYGKGTGSIMLYII